MRSVEGKQFRNCVMLIGEEISHELFLLVSKLDIKS